MEIMKQKIYILGMITTILVVLGAIFKMNHYPGAAYMLITGIAMLVLVFLPVALRNHYKTEGNSKNSILYFVTWLTCFVVFTSMLFKILHWPGAGILLIVSLPFPYVIFLPVFLYVTGKDKSFSIYNTVAVLFLLAGISVFSALLGLNVSRERINDSLDLTRSYNRLEKVLDIMPVNVNQTPVVQKIDDLLRIIDDYQARIYTSEGVTEEQWNKDPFTITRLESPDIASGALVIEGKDPSLDISLHNGLKSLILEAEKTPGYEAFTKAAPAIFEYTGFTDRPEDWTNGMFIATPRAWSLIYLDGLETNLKMIKASL